MDPRTMKMKPISSINILNKSHYEKSKLKSKKMVVLMK